MESCTDVSAVILRWKKAVMLFICLIQSSFSCRGDDDCPGSHMCQLQQGNGICVEQNGQTKENGAIVGILSAMIVLIVCLVALLAYICHRNVWGRQSWGSQTSLTTDAEEGERRNTTLVCTSSQTQDTIVTVPTYFLQRQLSIASNYSGPPPYFSIFSILTEDTQQVRRTEINTNEILEIEAVQVCELPPPSYETVREVFEETPPRYEDVITNNK